MLSLRKSFQEYDRLTFELDSQKKACNELRIENENLKKQVSELEKEVI